MRSQFCQILVAGFVVSIINITKGTGSESYSSACSVLLYHTLVMPQISLAGLFARDVHNFTRLGVSLAVNVMEGACTWKSTEKN